MNKTAIVVGATGLVGRSLVNQLLSHAGYERVIMLVRKKMHLTQAKLTQVEANFQDLQQVKSYFSEGAVVFCCLGTTMKTAGSKEAFYQVDYTFVANVAALAKEANAAQFLIVTASGA
ncbi:MAG: NAD(P)H-binding protein, partial [Bacteroidia bacterium]